MQAHHARNHAQLVFKTKEIGSPSLNFSHR